VNVSFNYATTICGFFLLFLLFVMIFFELLIALLQAYIFVVLVVIYLNDSIHLHV
jgi:F0F1-type ATP synthase membrane subunit a